MASNIPPIVKSTVQAAVLSATSNIMAQALTAYRTGVSTVISSGAHLLPPLCRFYCFMSPSSRLSLREANIPIRSQKAFSLNPIPLFHFTLFTLLNTPPNVLWQDFLESRFPGYTLQPRTVKTSSAQSTMPTSDSSLTKEQKDLNEKVDKDDQGEGAVKEKKLTEWTEEIRLERRLDKKNTAVKFTLDQTLGALINTVVYLAAMQGLRGAGWEGALAAVKKVRIFTRAILGELVSTERTCQCEWMDGVV